MSYTLRGKFELSVVFIAEDGTRYPVNNVTNLFLPEVEEAAFENAKVEIDFTKSKEKYPREDLSMPENMIELENIEILYDSTAAKELDGQNFAPNMDELSPEEAALKREADSLMERGI